MSGTKREKVSLSKIEFAKIKNFFELIKNRNHTNTNTRTGNLPEVLKELEKISDHDLFGLDTLKKDINSIDLAHNHSDAKDIIKNRLDESYERFQKKTNKVPKKQKVKKAQKAQVDPLVTAAQQAQVAPVAPVAPVVTQDVNPKDLKKIIPEFIQKNRPYFKYTPENQENINKLNEAIKNFYENPMEYIDNSENLRIEELESEIASYRAKIEEYRGFLEGQDPKIQLGRIEKQLEELDDLKKQSISRVEDEYIETEIQVHSNLKTFYQNLNDNLTPLQFLTNPAYAPFLAYFKLEKQEEELKKKLVKLNNSLSESQTTQKNLERKLKIYQALDEYVAAHTDPHDMPKFSGFIDSQKKKYRMFGESFDTQLIALEEGDPYFEELGNNKITNQYINKDENRYKDINQNLPNLKKSQEEQKKLAKKLATILKIYQAYQKYIEDQKSQGEWPTDQGFIVSQMSQLNVLGESFANEVEHLDEGDPIRTAYNEYKKNTSQNGINGFILQGKKNKPINYDPNIVPVYREYLQSFLAEGQSLDALDFLALEGGKVFEREKIKALFPENNKVFTIELPKEEKKDSYEKKALVERIKAISQKKENEWGTWASAQNKKLDEKDEQIGVLSQEIRSFENSLKEVEGLWNSYQKSSTPEDLADELKAKLKIDDISPAEVTKRFDEKRKEIDDKKGKLDTIKSEKQKISSDLKEYEYLKKQYDKKSTLKPVEIFSSSANPVTKVSYFNGTGNPIEIPKPENVSSYAFLAPVYSEYVQIEYQNKAILELTQDGTTRISHQKDADIRNKNEDEFVYQTLQQFENSKTLNKAIEINMGSDYDSNLDIARARILKKIVYQYCVDDKGKFHDEKLNTIKSAFIRGKAVTYAEIVGNKEFSFLQQPRFFQKAIRYLSDSKKKDKMKIAKIKEFDSFKLTHQSVPTDMSLTKSFRENFQKQQQKFNLMNCLKQNWKALTVGKDKEKELEKALYIMINTGTEKEFDKAWDYENSRDVALNEAIKLYKKMFQDTIKQDDLKTKIISLREEKRPDLKSSKSQP